MQNVEIDLYSCLLIHALYDLISYVVIYKKYYIIYCRRRKEYYAFMRKNRTPIKWF